MLNTPAVKERNTNIHNEIEIFKENFHASINYAIHIMIEETWRSSPRFSIPKIWPITAQGYRESHGHQFRYLLRPVRFVWFSLGQKLSRGLNDRGTLKDTTTSTKMRFCLVIYSLLNLWKLSWEFPGNSSIQHLFQLLKVDFDILFEHNHQPPPKIETENHVAGIQFFAWTTI